MMVAALEHGNGDSPAFSFLVLKRKLFYIRRNTLRYSALRALALLESGEIKSLRELARREGVDSSYVSRMVNLTTLAPDIVAAIFDETLPPEVTLFDVTVDPPALWEEQRHSVYCTS